MDAEFSLRFPVEPHLVRSGFSEARKNPLDEAVTLPHRALDFVASLGQEVMAAASGVVSRSYKGEQGPILASGRPAWYAYGERIVLSHPGGYQTAYAHLSSRFVFDGDQVRAGQVIGLAGATGYTSGPHLHFELMHGGKAIDPTPFLFPAAQPDQKGSV